MAQLTYPGVYVQEIPSGVQTITGVSTSITAFVDTFKWGPLKQPTLVQGWSEFERNFGGLEKESIASYCLHQFFMNGGSQAIIVRVAATDAGKASIAFGGWTLRAKSEGAWGKQLRARFESISEDGIFDLYVEFLERLPDGGDYTRKGLKVLNAEKFTGVSTDKESSRFVADILNESSELVELVPPEGGAEFSLTAVPEVADHESYDNVYVLVDGSDGGTVQATDVVAGINALDKVDLFNILCLPICANPPMEESTSETRATFRATVYSAGKLICEKRRAFLLVDIDMSTSSKEEVSAYKDDESNSFKSKNAALFFPRIQVADPLNSYRVKSIPVSGTIAGLFSRIDSTRGVWKAPAGVEALLNGVIKLESELTDDENGMLNPLGVNCLRRFPVYGMVNWGARTLVGSDQEGNEWKYIPVRRLALFIEESLFRGTKWVVFEPNDEPLWAQIRQSIGAFMMDLFRQGAFQGSTPGQAYYVRCDGTTTLPLDRQRGVVNIEVGFAPLKPAEFVVLKFQQIAAFNNN